MYEASEITECFNEIVFHRTEACQVTDVSYQITKGIELPEAREESSIPAVVVMNSPPLLFFPTMG